MNLYPFFFVLWWLQQITQINNSSSDDTKIRDNHRHQPPTQPSIPPGTVNEDQLRLGSKNRVWFILLADQRRWADQRRVGRYNWDPLRTRVIPERLRGVFTTRRYTNARLPLPLPYISPFTFTLPYTITNNNSNIRKLQQQQQQQQQQCCESWFLCFFSLLIVACLVVSNLCNWLPGKSHR